VHRLTAVAILLFFVGWGGLIYLIGPLQQPPDALGLAFFFPLFFLGTTAIAALLMVVLYRLWPGITRDRRKAADVIARQACWVGLFFTIAAGLQLRRWLDMALLAVLLVVFILIEAFWQQWRG